MTTDATELDAATEIGLSFKRALAAWRRLRGRETHHPSELSYAQFGLLGALSAGGALSTRELASAAELSPASATEMLDGLENAGLVVRVRSDLDKRVVLTSLTDGGAELVAARRAEWEPRWRSALGRFSDAELRTAASVLNELAVMFEGVAEG